MRILLEKNLAFDNQPKPIAFADVRRRVRRVKAKVAPPEVALEVSLFAHRVGASRATEVPSSRRGRREVGDEIRLRVEGVKIGRHAFPPPIPTKSFKPLGNKSRSFSKPLDTTGYLPTHLDLRPTPRRPPPGLARPPFTLPHGITTERKLGPRATTVFAPDDRLVFFDTTYPWSTCGRVDTPGGQSSGTMVGPRHLLTVSHAIQWLPNNTAGSVRFRPMLFDTSAPFGEAWGTLIYSKMKVDGPTIGWIEGMYDYVVVVLDRRIGDLTGWMGTRGYTDGWDGGDYWAHVGYPGDLTAGVRPTFQGGISLDGVWYEFDSHEHMSHHADVWPGQSGGSFFGWWSGDVGPRAVAVQSSQNSGENNASGGQDMVDLVIRARAENP
jgi:V8-like Glu-specific endopeptidase